MAREVLCGALEVFENRAAASGRRIPLHVVVLPATGAGKASDPLFYFSGGPGEGATGEAALIETDWSMIVAHRDVVLVDVRGTGQSNPLPCVWGDAARDFQSSLSGFLPVDLVRHCRPELDTHADLRLYTTSLAIDDVDDVRRALGYGRINIGGASYGTRAVQEFLRRHGDSVRTAFLWDVLPTGARMPLTFARDAQDAFDGLAAACAKEKSCHAAVPDLPGDLRRVIERLSERPAIVEVAEASPMPPVRFELTRDGFAQTVRYMLYSPKTAARIPVQVHLAAQGNFSPIAASAYRPVRDLISGISDGDYLSVTCSEDVPFFSEDEASRESRATFLGDFRWRMQKAACAEWQSIPVPRSFLDTVRSDIPTLLIAGSLDPVNPPRNSEIVARGLTRSRIVVVPRGAHDFEGMDGARCIDRILAAFLASGDERTLDTNCVEREMRPAPFVLN